MPRKLPATEVVSSEPPLGDDLYVEIDGEMEGTHVSPTNLDAAATLALASAYVRLVVEIAADQGTELRFTALEVVPKCAAIRLVPSDPGAAQQSARQGGLYIAGVEVPPSGFIGLVREAQAAVRKLPVGQRACVIAGPWRQDLSFAPESPALRSAPQTLAVRAIPIRVGGKRPAARFESASEAEQFTLWLSHEHARLLGSHLYKQVDIVGLVTRRADGQIEQGHLQEFHPVSEDDPTMAWRRWYREHAADWNEVRDVEVELGRTRD